MSFNLVWSRMISLELQITSTDFQIYIKHRTEKKEFPDLLMSGLDHFFHILSFGGSWRSRVMLWACATLLISLYTRAFLQLQTRLRGHEECKTHGWMHQWRHGQHVTMCYSRAGRPFPVAAELLRRSPRCWCSSSGTGPAATEVSRGSRSGTHRSRLGTPEEGHSKAGGVR